MPKKVNCIGEKGAFLPSNAKVSLMKGGEEIEEYSFMFFGSFAVDNDVIEMVLNSARSVFGNELRENSLEGGGGVLQSESHHRKVKVSVLC